jgi:hypothetical protein
VNWRCIAGNWRHFKRRAKRWGRPTQGDVGVAPSREAGKKRLADWAADRHDIDPIHK